MSSILHSERHQTALRLEKEIIGDLPPGRSVKPGSKYIRAERAIGKFLRYELDEQELREALEAIAATARRMGDISLTDYENFARNVTKLTRGSHS